MMVIYPYGDRGDWVFDEHLSTGFADGRQVHAVRVYRIEAGRIESIQVFT